MYTLTVYKCTLEYMPYIMHARTHALANTHTQLFNTNWSIMAKFCSIKI